MVCTVLLKGIEETRQLEDKCGRHKTTTDEQYLKFMSLIGLRLYPMKPTRHQK